ncbi:cell surface composition regulator GlgS [Citrobacter enshiensis]|uniref:Surface composition regulator n=1 Tax=Citrobacter enshiensis TaxID=2971264 RepID=A0ABT8PVA9_9ENTR|nr:cell surface composition regulator GlgS [Citrobacter enshiensis]MDN8600208.1 cell surface composition regulator GlgS [Citrobacter enshiensis]WET41277.1 cell surface composition regulator GlgS [Citrobacter enshiensis]
MLMNNNNVYSLNNFDFLARSFARMQAEGRPVDIHAVTGNMDEEHRSWFCKRYALYCQQATRAKKLELEH